jgi:2-hydroxychromene-2-carboxylate isomerase
MRCGAVFDGYFNPPPPLMVIATGTRMDQPKRMTVYSDYKSPYAYLAKDPVYELEAAFAVEIDWLPYTLDIPAYLGSARLDARGEVIEQNRNAHQWRRVRYSYMDCRRQARKRGLIIRGTRKIWDSSLANTGMLWAKRQGRAQLRAYHDRVFDRFWRRELDIEDVDVLTTVLLQTGIDAGGFADYLFGQGRRELDEVRSTAETAGVFGVPSFVIDGELFWGSEHLPDIRERLVPRALPPATGSAVEPAMPR